MVIDERLEHSKNVELPMLVTELGIETEVKFQQLPNKPSPMLVTELGMVMDIRFLQ